MTAQFEADYIARFGGVNEHWTQHTSDCMLRTSWNEASDAESDRFVEALIGARRMRQSAYNKLEDQVGSDAWCAAIILGMSGNSATTTEKMFGLPQHWQEF